MIDRMGMFEDFIDNSGRHAREAALVFWFWLLCRVDDDGVARLEDDSTGRPGRLSRRQVILAARRLVEIGRLEIIKPALLPGEPTTYRIK